MYDYLVVGSGLFGSVFACEANKKGKKVLVIDKRPNIAGNVYTQEIEGINVHLYGAHIFHTNLKHVWEYVNYFAEFNRFKIPFLTQLSSKRPIILYPIPASLIIPLTSNSAVFPAPIISTGICNNCTFSRNFLVR